MLRVLKSNKYRFCNRLMDIHYKCLPNLYLKLSQKMKPTRENDFERRLS